MVVEEGLHYVEAQKLIRERLCGARPPPKIFGLDKERRQLHDLIHRTAAFGESNSIIVIGPRGGGKSMLLKNIVEEINKDTSASSNLMPVFLNGLMQTDDRLALKEITRQLALENCVGDKVFGSFAENLQFLLNALKGGGQHTKSILFVLDEFDLFAHHRNQTLLYNLFDVSQSAQAPICVVGLTARLDVIELLEKRVKSRFSHRLLHLLPSLTWNDYLQVLRDYLQLPGNFVDKSYAKKWNKKVQEISDDVSVQDMLRRQFNLTREIRPLLNILMLPVARVNDTKPYLTVNDFVDSGKVISLDSKSAMLHGVSVLELCLIIAMKHLTDIYDGEPFNFEMVFKEYQTFSRKKSGIQTFDKAVVMKAFDHLCALELVRPAEGTGVRTQKEYRPQTLLVDSSQITDALQKYPNCPTEVRQWASSSLA